jgi:GDPmannose 4,6-dehydratase
MWKMLQEESPEDYIIATGETHSVREFVEKAFQEIGIEIVWEGSKTEEVGKDKANGKILVRIDPRYFRPTEVEFLLGDPSKAKKNLGWKPKTSFDELIKMMIKDDLKEAEKDNLCEKEGFQTFHYFE